MERILHNLHIRDFTGMAGRVVFQDEMEDLLNHHSIYRNNHPDLAACT